MKSLNLDLEHTIPTWWSSVQLLLAGLLLGLVAVRNAVIRPGASLVLALFALLLVFLSMDEVSTLHERAGVYLDRIVGDRRGTVLHITGLWFVVVGVPFAIVVVLLLHRLAGFLAEVPGTRVRLLLGVAVLLAGAAGVEALSNLAAPEGLGRRLILHHSYMVTIAFEEFLEMCGGSLLLWTSLGILRNHWTTRAVFRELRPLSESEAAALRPR